MPEKLFPTLEEPEPQIADIKAELLKRPVPEEYRPLIRGARFMTSPQYFSRHLGAAISDEPLSTEVKYKQKLKSVPEIKSILDKSSSEFGEAFKNAVAGKSLVDLASGGPSNALVRSVAEAIGAKRYIGVDSMLREEQSMADESGQDENFQATYIKDDVLSFVSKMERPESGVVFYISGLEPVYFLSTHKEEENLKRRSREVEKDRIARNYIDACLKELARVTEPGDVVVIGQGTKAFKPENYGFQLKSQTGEQFLFERV